MKTNYLILLDYSCGEVIKIKLSEEEQQIADQFENFEEFIYSIEEEYGFRLKDYCWMATETLVERSF